MKDLIVTSSDILGYDLDMVQGKIYWYHSRSIHRANLDGTNVESIISTDDSIRSMAIDRASGKIYWTEFQRPSNLLVRANLDGSGREELLTMENRSIDLAINSNGGKIYFLTYYKIQQSNLNGTELEDLINFKGQEVGRGEIFLDVNNQKIYWLVSTEEFPPRFPREIRSANLDGTEVQLLFQNDNLIEFTMGNSLEKVYWLTANGRIRKSNLNGSDIENIFSPVLLGPSGIAVDAMEGHIYWSDSTTDTIQRANYNESGIEELITLGPDRDAPVGISLDTVNRKMYWIEVVHAKFRRANLDGSGTEDITPSVGVIHPRDMALDVAAGKFYWTDGGRIQRANLDGSGRQPIINQLSSPWNIALDLSRGKIYWNQTGILYQANLNGTGSGRAV